MDGAELFSKSLEQATAVVKQVLPVHLSNPTPDTEWDVRDLVGHMLYELSWVKEMVSGKTIADVGNKYDGDLVGDEEDLASRWQVEADRAEMAAEESDPDETAHVSYGDITNDDYLRQVGGDLLIHTWDLGKAIGVTVKFDPEVAQIIYDGVLPTRDSLQASGLFAPPLEVSDSADIQTKLLALFGRDANWKPA